MFKFVSIAVRFRLILLMGVLLAVSACKKIEAETSSLSSASSSSNLQFASGTKVVRINTSNAAMGGSFSSTLTSVPANTVIPTNYPGADGSSYYKPGVSAQSFYDVDGTTGMSKPSWLIDFQLGITGLTSASCSTFGSGSTLDPLNFFRVSESNCGSTALGTGSSLSDPAFFRIVLDRDTSKIGSAENLLIQVEYQASGVRLSSNGTNASVESNLDQVWKIFWKESLLNSASAYAFGLFVPPNFSSCISSGTSTAGSPGDCQDPNYRGSPIQTRQFIIPLSAYPNMKVIQFSRIRSKINDTIDPGYVPAFCTSADPLCLGVVVRSVTLMRI